MSAPAELANTDATTVRTASAAAKRLTTTRLRVTRLFGSPSESAEDVFVRGLVNRGQRERLHLGQCSAMCPDAPYSLGVGDLSRPRT